MELTAHARQRWLQRCRNLDYDAEVSALRRAGKTTLNRLRRSWERSQGLGTWPAHYDYLVGPSGTLFVVVDGYVLTVMLLREVKYWDNRRSKDDRLRRRHALL